jgi:hypothetical protein
VVTQLVVVTLFVTTIILALLSTVLTIAGRRPDVRFFRDRVSTYKILTHPEKYLRAPFARFARLSGIAALALAVSWLLLMLALPMLR